MATFCSPNIYSQEITDIYIDEEVLVVENSDEFDDLAMKQKSLLENILSVNLSFTGLGLSYQLPVSGDVLIEIESGLGASYKINQDFEYRMRINDPSFYASLSVQYFYNIDKSKVKKNFKNNNGNFWGFRSKFVSKSIVKYKDSNTFFLSSNWGLRRNIYKNFSFEFIMGVGAAVDFTHKQDYNFTIFPEFNFKLSYNIPLNF